MNMHLRPPNDVRDQIKEVAAAEGNSVDTEGVVAIREHIARHQTEEVRRDALEIAEEDADLLARLAE